MWSEQLEQRCLLSDCGCSVAGLDSNVVRPPDELATPADTPALSVLSDVGVQASSSDSSNETPTGWLWYHGVDAAFLGARAAEGYRLVDLEPQSTDPLLFTAAFVQNSGEYAKGWWWYYNATAADIGNFANANNARITDIESYVIGGQRRYAAIMISNTGADAKGWWWYFNVNSTDISNALTANNARLVDIDQHTGGANRTFDVVMISNTGADNAGWWYYYSQTPSSIANLLNTNRARLVDIEPVDSGHFDVIMERTPISHYWWYYGVNANELNDLVAQNGSRLFHVVPYDDGGTQHYAAIMVGNSNAPTTRVGDILRGSSDDGNKGLYLKEVGGPVLASLLPDKRFEPASMIKALLELTSMRRVAAGTDSLTNTDWMYFNPANPYVSFASPGNPDECPDQFPQTASNRVSLSLQTILERMMERSDNRATRTIDQRYGRAAINATAQLAGMASSAFASTLGCGVPGNYLTLADTGRMYEGIINGTLLGGQARTDYWRFMTDEDDSDREAVPFQDGIDGGIVQVVTEEAASLLGRPQSDPLVQALKDAFLGEVTNRRKGGSYDLGYSASEYTVVRTIGGMAGLPFKDGSGNTVMHNYVYGLFVDQAHVPNSPQPSPQANAIANAVYGSQGELMREQIRAALATWRVNPRVSIGTARVTEGDSGTVTATFTVTLSGRSDVPVRVSYSTAPGTALSPADFTAESGVVNFAAGDTSQPITISVKGDTLDEDNETFSITLSNPVNATLGDATGFGSIIDDDAPPTVRVNDVRHAEGNSGTTAFEFTVSLSAASSKAVVVGASTANGTAVAPGDYTAATATVTFNPGETTKTFTVQANGDIAIEPDETFLVNLANPVNATLGDASGTGFILNDDQAVTLPVVTQVYVAGTAWTAAFKNFLQANGLGSATLGFAVPDGAAQLDEMPWSNLNQVSLKFNVPVLVQQDDLRVLGVNVPTYGYSNFAYDPATYVATWTLNQPVVNDRLVMHLDADGPNGVTDAGGTRLDGNWVNGGDTYPSGDGAAGTEFRFLLNVLPGDVNRSGGTVNAVDLSQVRSRQLLSTTSPGAPPTAYGAFYDVNGNGAINAVDLGQVRAYQLKGLPPGAAALEAPALKSITRDLFGSTPVV